MASAPVNISKDNIKGKCSLKCKYSHNYGISSVNITNKEDYIKIKLTNPSVSKETVFNNEKYQVNEARIYYPSLHQYNGKNADAELLISHSGEGENLIVSIPISTKQSGTLGEIQLETIIDEACSRIPSSGSSATLSLKEFSLDNLIPSKSFYSYTGTLPYDPFNGTYNYVLFDERNAVGVSSSVIKKLKKIISETSVDVEENYLYFNKEGVTKSSGSDNIYIDCQPVDESGEVIVPNSSSSSSTSSSGSFDISGLFKNPVFLVILGLIGGFILLKLIKLVFTKIESSNIQMPTSSGIKKSFNNLKNKSKSLIPNYTSTNLTPNPSVEMV